MLKMPEAAAELIAGAAEAIECTRGFECERICFCIVAALLSLLNPHHLFDIIIIKPSNNQSTPDASRSGGSDMGRGLQNVQKQRHSAGVSGCGGELNHLAVEWSRDYIGLLGHGATMRKSCCDPHWLAAATNNWQHDVRDSDDDSCADDECSTMTLVVCVRQRIVTHCACGR